MSPLACSAPACRAYATPLLVQGTTRAPWAAAIAAVLSVLPLSTTIISCSPFQSWFLRDIRQSGRYFSSFSAGMTMLIMNRYIIQEARGMFKSNGRGKRPQGSLQYLTHWDIMSSIVSVWVITYWDHHGPRELDDQDSNYLVEERRSFDGFSGQVPSVRRLWSYLHVYCRGTGFLQVQGLHQRAEALPGLPSGEEVRTLRERRPRCENTAADVSGEMCSMR